MQQCIKENSQIRNLRMSSDRRFAIEVTHRHIETNRALEVVAQRVRRVFAPPAANHSAHLSLDIDTFLYIIDLFILVSA